MDLSLVRIARFGLALALTLICVAQPALAERATHVYRPKYRLAEELLPLAQAGLGDAGSAAVDRGTNSLVLIGEAEAIQDALALLAKQDRRPRTIVLRYESHALSELEASGVRVEWSVSSGGVRIGNVRGARGKDSVALELRRRSERETGSFSGQLRLVDGASGRISTGTSVPVTVRRRGGRVTTDLIRAESGFEASARVLGDGRVRVALAPFEAQLGSGPSLEVVSADTEVELTPGETVAIGEISRRTRAEADSPASRDDAEAHEERVLLLSATLE